MEREWVLKLSSVLIATRLFIMFVSTEKTWMPGENGLTELLRLLLGIWSFVGEIKNDSDH